MCIEAIEHVVAGHALHGAVDVNPKGIFLVGIFTVGINATEALGKGRVFVQGNAGVVAAGDMGELELIPLDDIFSNGCCEKVWDFVVTVCIGV